MSANYFSSRLSLLNVFAAVSQTSVKEKEMVLEFTHRHGAGGGNSWANLVHDAWCVLGLSLSVLRLLTSGILKIIELVRDA